MSSVKRYSCSIMLWAFRVYAGAPRTYAMMRTTYLTLPHPSYIRKLASVFTMKSGLDRNVHDEYMKQKCAALSEAERRVILMVDEIHMYSCMWH